MMCSTTTFIERSNNFGKTIYNLPYADFIGWENHWGIIWKKNEPDILLTSMKKFMNVTDAAEKAGISRMTLYRKIQKDN